MDKNEIQEHPTWAIIDSSKLQTYQACPRKYFYNYVLGWDLTRESHHLVFGEAWHRAMEHLLINGYNSNAMAQAAGIAEEYYRRHFTASTDVDRGAKTPSRLKDALIDYVMMYGIDKFEVLHTEISGVVPVSEEGRLIHFRMDSVLRDPMYQGKITSLEHKTGSRNDAFEKYKTNIQSGTYTHVLFSAYSLEEVYGIIINGFVPYVKADPFFQRLPGRKNEDDMAEWLWTVNHLMDRIDWDMEELNETGDDEQLMPCFMKNTEACFMYGKCLFYDICHTWPNPVQNCHTPPFGYKEKRWDPSAREAKAVFEGGEITPVQQYLEEIADDGTNENSEDNSPSTQIRSAASPE